jgi:CubicO group peptidase (beta-lactamase class C family)
MRGQVIIGRLCPRLYVLLLSISVIGANLASPCAAQNPASPAYWPTHGWRSTAPEQQGIDSNKLADALDYIRKNEIKIHSLLIVRNGFIVLDAYFFPYTENYVHDLASVTKSVTSTLIGVAIGQGKIKSVQQPLLTIFPARSIRNRDALKDKLTIEHLLVSSQWPTCVLGTKLGVLAICGFGCASRCRRVLFQSCSFP